MALLGPGTDSRLTLKSTSPLLGAVLVLVVHACYCGRALQPQWRGHRPPTALGEPDAAETFYSLLRVVYEPFIGTDSCRCVRPSAEQ